MKNLSYINLSRWGIEALEDVSRHHATLAGAIPAIGSTSFDEEGVKGFGEMLCSLLSRHSFLCGGKERKRACYKVRVLAFASSISEEATEIVNTRSFNIGLPVKREVQLLTLFAPSFLTLEKISHFKHLLRVLFGNARVSSLLGRFEAS